MKDAEVTYFSPFFFGEGTRKRGLLCPILKLSSNFIYFPGCQLFISLLHVVSLCAMGDVSPPLPYDPTLCPLCGSLIRLLLDGPLRFLTNHLSRKHTLKIKSNFVLFRPPRPIFAWLIHTYIGEDNIII